MADFRMPSGPIERFTPLSEAFKQFKQPEGTDNQTIFLATEVII